MGPRQAAKTGPEPKRPKTKEQLPGQLTMQSVFENASRDRPDRVEFGQKFLGKNEKDLELDEAYRLYDRDIKALRAKQSLDDQADTTKSRNTRTKRKLLEEDDDDPLALSSEDEDTPHCGPTSAAQSRGTTVYTNATNYIASCRQKMWTGPLSFTDQTRLVSMIRHCHVHHIPALSQLAMDAMDVFLELHHPVRVVTGPSAGLPSICTATDIWNPLMCETTDKKDKLRLQDSATDNKTAKEAAAIFEKGLRAAFAACEGQELSEEGFGAVLWTQLAMRVVEEDLAVRLRALEERRDKGKKDDAKQPFIGHYEGAMIHRIIESCSSQTAPLGSGVFDRPEAGAPSSKWGLAAVCVRLVGKAGELCLNPEAWVRNGDVRQCQMMQRVGGFEGLRRLGASVLGCILDITSVLERIHAYQSKRTVNRRVKMDQILLAVSDSGDAVFRGSFAAKQAVIDSLSADHAVRFAAYTVAIRRTDRTSFRMAQEKEDFKFLIMLKDRYHLGSGDGAPVASYLKSVHEVLKYCVFDWDYKLGGTAKMMASAVGTEGADGVALLVSRMILGCIEVAKRNPNSADARSLHELVEPLEELINVAKELCTMAGGLDLVGALAALHRAVDELAGE